MSRPRRRTTPPKPPGRRRATHWRACPRCWGELVPDDTDQHPDCETPDRPPTDQPRGRPHPTHSFNPWRTQ